MRERIRQSASTEPAVNAFCQNSPLRTETNISPICILMLVHLKVMIPNHFAFPKIISSTSNTSQFHQPTCFQMRRGTCLIQYQINHFKFCGFLLLGSDQCTLKVSDNLQMGIVRLGIELQAIAVSVSFYPGGETDDITEVQISMKR